MNHQRYCKGQSLVEFAIIVPILIFFTIGIFEVGYALRNQFILINISRETARFATKQDYLNVQDNKVIGYESIIEHSLGSSAGQLKGFDYKDNSGLIISNIIVSISPTNCISSTFDILHPGMPGVEYLKYQTSDKYQSKIDYDKIAIEISQTDLDISCGLYDRGISTVQNNHIVIVEVFYDSYQLIGFPIIKNSFTDPIQLYSKTIMRKVKGR